MSQSKKPAVFLPLLDLSSKHLSLHGHEHPITYRTLNRETLEQMGANIHTRRSLLPSYKNKRPLNVPIHKKWCKAYSQKGHTIKAEACTCKLLNPSPPSPMRIFISATRTNIEKELDLGVQLASLGATNLSHLLTDALVLSEGNFDSERDRLKTFVYPVLDTPWNQGRGKYAYLRLQRLDNEEDEVPLPVSHLTKVALPNDLIKDPTKTDDNTVEEPQEELSPNIDENGVSSDVAEGRSLNETPDIESPIAAADNLPSTKATTADEQDIVKKVPEGSCTFFGIEAQESARKATHPFLRRKLKAQPHQLHERVPHVRIPSYFAPQHYYTPGAKQFRPPRPSSLSVQSSYSHLDSQHRLGSTGSFLEGNGFIAHYEEEAEFDVSQIRKSIRSRSQSAASSSRSLRF